MSIEHVHFIVEEPSMEMFLRAVLPRILRATASMEARKLLPNASYFAFTATPKNKTLTRRARTPSHMRSRAL